MEEGEEGGIQDGVLERVDTGCSTGGRVERSTGGRTGGCGYWLDGVPVGYIQGLHAAAALHARTWPSLGNSGGAAPLVQQAASHPRPTAAHTLRIKHDIPRKFFAHIPDNELLRTAVCKVSLLFSTS